MGYTKKFDKKGDIKPEYTSDGYPKHWSEGARNKERANDKKYGKNRPGNQAVLTDIRTNKVLK